jgi:hypothetical protein
MGSWKQDRPKQLKKIVYALTETTLLKLIKTHENRGWSLASEIKKHRNGLGCLMICDKREVERENRWDE